MKTIVALGFKGGTGKTTVSLHLAAGLARFHNKKVLLIDYDPQANLSQGLGYNPDSKDTMVPVLQGYKNINEVITETKIKNLYLIRANTYLDQVESSSELLGDYLSVLRLKKAIEKLEGDFDFCFIDVPPSLGWLCKSASLAADHIIINSVPEPYSILAMARLKAYIETNQEETDISLLGVVLSKWDSRTVLSRESIEALSESFPQGVFSTKIRTDMSVNNAILSGEPVFDYDPSSRAAEDFKELAKEFIERVESLKEGSHEEKSQFAGSR